MPPSAHHVLQDLAVILTVAAITTVACQRLRLPVIVGYIVAGVLTGAANPFRLIGDPAGIRDLSELGVILIMYAIGLEFSLRRLVRLVPVVGVAATVEMGLMFGLGYAIGQLAGWGGSGSLFAGSVIAISSTMVVAKAFEERKPTRRVEDLVFGVLLMEDLVAILLLVVLTAEASGRAADAGLLGTLVRLLGFLAILLVAGMAVIPRAVRAVVRLGRDETTLVAAVGIAFLFAFLAERTGYSVALGAFLAGALVRESGEAHRIIGLLRPVRDLFVAIFFVAIGMLIVPGEVVQAWPLVLVLTIAVLIGKTVGVSVGGFLAGFGIRTSVRSGFTLAQIGEFSFVIASVGLLSGAAPPDLYPVVVAVSIVTALLAPTLSRLADPVAATVDRRLPHRVQTFVTLYESWVELLKKGTKPTTTWSAIRRPLRWMVVDAAAIAGIIAGVSVLRGRVPDLVGNPRTAGLMTPVLIAGGALACLPFAIALVTSARRVARRLAEAAMPRVARGVDQAHAPRGVLVVALQMATVLVFGIPLLVVTQPFLSAWPAAVVIGVLLVLLAIAFWRATADLYEHTMAGAELIVDVLARQSAAPDDRHTIEVVQEMLPGLGTLVPFTVPPGSAVVGQSLAALNLRGLTGVTIVGMSRGGSRIPYPDAREVLQVGDVLALTGSHDAIAAAHRLLRGEPLRPSPAP